MDLITVVLIFIFFVLPVIQQIMEHRRKGRSPEDLDEYDPDWESVRVEAPEEVRRPQGTSSESRTGTEVRRPQPASAESGAGTEAAWSEGWGAWPGASSEAERIETQREVPPPTVPAPPTVPSSRPGRASRPVPSEPVKLEPVVLSRPDATRAPIAMGPRSSGPASLRRTPRPKPALKAQPIRRLGLNDKASLRKAVILRELLGPPLALREQKDDRADFH